MANITPDDSTIGEKPWSSKNIVDMLCPPLEESGNPVVCYPVAGYPLGVKASWEPTQEGSGTPSPENIRPIKGRDSVKVERCGENLLPPIPETATSFITIHYDTDGTLTVKGTVSSETSIRSAMIYVPPGTYVISSTASLPDGMYISATENRTEKLVLSIRDSLKTGTLSGNIGSLLYLKPGTYDFRGKIALVPGSTPPTTYTPYTGQTNTLTLPETVYGGEVYAVSGEGQKVWETITLDGTEEWRWETRYCEAVRKSYGIPNSINDISAAKLSQKADRYIIDNPYANTLADKCVWIWSSPTAHYAIVRIKHADKQTSLDNWKSYLAAQYAAGTPVQVCYKLASPDPFTATGAQPIPALAGVNTVLTDADSATVTGRADPIKRITDLETSIASMT